MKKSTVLAALLLAVSAGTTALAQTEYDPSNNSVNNSDQTGYKTVLITKGSVSDTVTDGNIVYVDQADTRFEGATNFLLKKDPADGVYTIRLGGGSEGTTATAQFEFAVGVGIEGYDTKLEPKGEPVQDANSKYSYGFVTPAEGVDFSNGGIILVKVDNRVMAYPANNGLTLTGNVKAMFGVQIDGIDADQNIEVYFRPGASVVTE